MPNLNLLISDYPFRKKIIHIKNKHNVGFAKAVNQGIKKINGTIVLVTNADISFSNYFLNQLKSEWDQSDFEIAAHQLINKKNTSLQSLGIKMTSVLLRAKHALTIQESVGPCGASFSFKKENLNKLTLNSPHQLLNPSYFFLWEDIEFAHRLNKNKIKIKYSKLQCIHIGNHTKSSYFLKQYLSIRNRKKVIQTYYPNYKKKYPLAFFYDFFRWVLFVCFNPWSNKKKFYKNWKKKAPKKAPFKYYNCY